MREQRHRDGRIRVAHDGIRKLRGINLAPAHSFAGSRAGETAGVGTRVGDLDEEVLALDDEVLDVIVFTS